MRVNSDGIFLDPASLPPPGEVVIDGVALPFVDQTTAPAGVSPGTFNAALFTVGPVASPGDAPEGYLVPATAGPVGGLTAAQVSGIISNAVATANQTRALIRLPLGSRAKMSIAVSDLDGTIIGLYRMTDGTVFSIDVAATKARNVIYFSGTTRQPMDLNGVPMGTAVTNRTIGFGAQPFFPPGIDGSAAGPFFNLFLQDVNKPCTQGFQVPGPSWPAGQSKRNRILPRLRAAVHQWSACRRPGRQRRRRRSGRFRHRRRRRRIRASGRHSRGPDHGQWSPSALSEVPP